MQITSNNALIYKNLFETMKEIFYLFEIIHNETGKPVDIRYIEGNPACYQHANLTRENMIGHTHLELFQFNPSWITWLAHFENVVRTGKTEHFADSVDETGRIFDVFAFSHSPGVGAVVMDDITDQRRVEEERKRIFDLVPDMIVVASADGFFKEVNPAWEKILGYTSEELLAKPFSEFIHPDDIASTFAEVERQIKGQATINFINRYRCKDGTYKLLDWVATPSPDGNLLYAAARDITERVAVVEELHESETALKTSQAVARVGNWTWDTVTNRVAWSDEMYRIFGIQQGDGEVDLNEVINRSIHPDDRDKLEESNQAGVRDAHPAPLEYRVVWQDGSIHYVSATPLEPVKDPAGKIIKLTGIVQEITERKRIEDAAEVSKLNLEALLASMNDAVLISDTEGNFSIFKIYLPLAEHSDEGQETSVEIKPAQGGSECILVVEDERTLLDLCCETLEGFGYHVLPAENPIEAIEQVREHSGRINLLITDVIMPEMNGRDMANRIGEINPGIKVLFTSGYTANLIAHHGVLEKGVNYIQKPYLLRSLAEKVREILDHE